MAFVWPVVLHDLVACCELCSAKMAEWIEVLFVMWTPGDPAHIVLDGGPDTSMVRGFAMAFAKLLILFL